MRGCLEGGSVPKRSFFVRLHVLSVFRMITRADDGTSLGPPALLALLALTYELCNFASMTSSRNILDRIFSASS